MERKDRQAEKESFFKNRVQPNIILTGWTAWCSRMESERRKEEKSAMNNIDWSKSRAYANNIKKENYNSKFVHMPSSTSRPSAPRCQFEKCAAEVRIKFGQSPKRKNNFNPETFNQGSPAKIRKTSTFVQNLNYWKEIENTQVVPTESALRTKTKTEIHSHTRLTRLETIHYYCSFVNLTSSSVRIQLWIDYKLQ